MALARRSCHSQTAVTQGAGACRLPAGRLDRRLPILCFWIDQDDDLWVDPVGKKKLWDPAAAASEFDLNLGLTKCLRYRKAEAERVIELASKNLCVLVVDRRIHANRKFDMLNRHLSLSGRVATIEDNQPNAASSGLKKASEQRIVEHLSVSSVRVLEGKRAVAAVAAEMENRGAYFIDVIE